MPFWLTAKFYPIPFGVFIKILLSIAMIYISFRTENVIRFMKQLLIFYLSTFTLGGVVFAFLYLVKPTAVWMKNGVYMGTYPIKIAFLGGKVGFVLLTIAFRVIKGKIHKRDMYCAVEIYMNQKSEKIIALLDTGNLLREPITGIPVLVIEKEALSNLLPPSILNHTNDIMNGNMGTIEETYQSKFRIIPFQSLGKQNGMLLGIKADKVIVEYDERKIEHTNIILGIYEKELCKSHIYRALIGLDLLDGSEQKNEYFGNVKV